MQAKTIDKSEFFKPWLSGRLSVRMRWTGPLLARCQFKSHCIKRQEKPFNLLVTKICYLLNCAIKNENANEMWTQRRDAAKLCPEPRSILIYHRQWPCRHCILGMGKWVCVSVCEWVARGSSRHSVWPRLRSWVSRSQLSILDSRRGWLLKGVDV